MKNPPRPAAAWSASEIDAFLERLFPLCRSITGNGVRETLSIIAEYVPIQISEVPTGDAAFDWTVPAEWNIRDAYILAPDGRKIADFKKNNLHVVGYSIPVRANMSLEELRPHLYSLPEQPAVIPYKTSYYNPDWGFCLEHATLESLKEGTYEVCIDSTLEKGALTFGELLIPGKNKEEVLISCYVCHPSMANDNLSGISVATFLARSMIERKHHYSYRFIFVPETIGTIVWLARNREHVRTIKYGLVATCAGDSGPFTYKRSRRGNAGIDRIVERVLKSSGAPYSALDFFPLGSDERQFCSPGFDLPVGSLMRTMYYNFPQYHTSADNLTFVRGEYLADTLSMYAAVVDAIEHEVFFRSKVRFGEPQLGKRGLYETIGGQKDHDVQKRAMLWVLNLSDGEHSLADISERSGIPLVVISGVAEKLQAQNLLERIG